MVALIFYSLLAGVAGTGVGGIISVFIKCRDNKIMTYLLNFAGGMMISITCFKLIPESVQLGGIAVSIGGISLGAALIMALNKVVDRMEEKRFSDIPHKELSELMHAEELVKEIKHNKEHHVKGELSDAAILRAGIIMLFAIALHNLPEGLAIGSTGSYNIQIGLVLAFTIAFHNVPEGMAIAVPLSVGGMGKVKTVIWTAASGLTTVIGAIIGYLIGGISDAVASLALGFAGGAMMYVTFGEIMPQAILMCNNRKSVIFSLFGFLLGMAVMYLT
ncbi:MAG: ZIP family metal transporter [Christensenellales bacterium]|jgi:ZIP family zinc transporter